MWSSNITADIIDKDLMNLIVIADYDVNILLNGKLESYELTDDTFPFTDDSFGSIKITAHFCPRDLMCN